MTAYRIDPAHNVSAELRRIVIEQGSAAIEAVRSIDGDRNESEVHRARRCCKKARAALRLAAPLVGQAELKATLAGVRDASRALTTHRDAAVLVRTIVGLREASPDETSSEFVDQIQLEVEGRRDDMAASATDAEGVAGLIQLSLRRVRAWEGVGLSDVQIIERGLKRSSERSALAFRSVGAGNEFTQPEVWHEWRKALKDVWYHSRLLEAAWPPVMEGLSQGLGRAAEDLGSAQDLSLLIERLRAGRGTEWNPHGADVLVRLAEHRRAVLWRDARSVGARLHAEAPARFAARIARAWRVSAGGGAEQP